MRLICPQQGNASSVTYQPSERVKQTRLLLFSSFVHPPFVGGRDMTRKVMAQHRADLHWFIRYGSRKAAGCRYDC